MNADLKTTLYIVLKLLNQHLPNEYWNKYFIHVLAKKQIIHNLSV